VKASKPYQHTLYGTGSESKKIQRDHPEWENFDPLHHPEWQKLLCMFDRGNLTMSDLKLITDRAAVDEGISPPGRPYSRRKAGMAEWIAKHWKSVKKVVRNGEVHLEGTTETKTMEDPSDGMQSSSHLTFAAPYFVSDQLDEEDDGLE
jgi:hypothetical protein